MSKFIIFGVLDRLETVKRVLKQEGLEKGLKELERQIQFYSSMLGPSRVAVDITDEFVKEVLKKPNTTGLGPEKNKKPALQKSQGKK